MNSMRNDSMKSLNGLCEDASKKQRCLARTRNGGLCRRWAELNPQTGLRKRCRLHGGLSTGPRTEAGKARAVAAVFKNGAHTTIALQRRRELRLKLAALKAELKKLSHAPL